MGWVPFQLLYLGPFSNVRCSLVDLYNNKFNCFVRPQYDGSHQTFPDLNMKMLGDRYGISSIYQSQKD